MLITLKKETKNVESTEQFEQNSLKNSPSTNIIENVEYSSKDSSGNEYTIKAEYGEIDINQNNIIFLTNVSAVIKLRNSKKF